MWHDNVDLLAYHDLDGRSGFKLAMQEVEGRFFLYVAGFWHSGWSILDVTDPEHPELLRFLEGPPNTWTLQVQVADGTMITALEHLPPGLTIGDPAGLAVLAVPAAPGLRMSASPPQSAPGAPARAPVVPPGPPPLSGGAPPGETGFQAPGTCGAIFSSRPARNVLRAVLKRRKMLRAAFLALAVACCDCTSASGSGPARGAGEAVRGAVITVGSFGFPESVLLARRDVVARYGPRLVAVLNTVSARLTTGSLRALNAQVQLRGEDPRLLAGSWLRTQGLAPMGGASR